MTRHSFQRRFPVVNGEARALIRCWSQPSSSSLGLSGLTIKLNVVKMALNCLNLVSLGNTWFILFKYLDRNGRISVICYGLTLTPHLIIHSVFPFHIFLAIFGLFLVVGRSETAPPDNKKEP